MDCLVFGFNAQVTVLPELKVLRQENSNDLVPSKTLNNFIEHFGIEFAIIGLVSDY